MSIQALQTALTQYQTELQGSNATRLTGAVYYHREWEVSANVVSNTIKNFADLTQVHAYILDSWNGTPNQLLVSTSLYSFDWKVFLPYKGTPAPPTIGADFGLDGLNDLSVAYASAIAFKSDLVFNGVELVRPGFFDGISVASYVFFQFPTIVNEADQDLPDSAGVLAVPARGTEAIQWIDQFSAQPWRAATLANLAYTSNSTTVLDEAIKIAKQSFESFSTPYTLEITKAWGTSTKTEDIELVNVEIKGTPRNTHLYKTIYLTLQGSAGPHWNGFEPPKLSDVSADEKNLPWSYAPLKATTLADARDAAAKLNTIDLTSWSINKTSDKVQYTFTKLNNLGQPDGPATIDFYSA